MKRKWSLNKKFYLSIIPITTIIILVLGVVVYQSRYLYHKKSNEEKLETELNSLYALLEANYKERTNTVKLALELLHSLFYSKLDSLTYSPTPVTIAAINQNTKTFENVTFYPLMHNGASLYQNYTLVDNVKYKTGVTATIFQKISQGYLRISTNLVGSRGERAINTYISRESQVIKAIESGQTYLGRAFAHNEWYIAAYEPIMKDGQIVGMLSVGLPEKELGSLGSFIVNKKIYDKGYIALVGNDGRMIVNSQADSVYRKKAYFNTMLQTKVGKVNSVDHQGEEYVEHYKYFEPYNSFIVVRAYKDDYLTKPLRNVILLIVVCVPLAVLLFSLILHFLLKSVTAPIRRIVDAIKSLSKGSLPDKIEIKSSDEIGEIAENTNKLIEGLKETVAFAQEIGKNNFSYEFKPLSDDDILGKSLIDMRENLLKAEEEEKKRLEEQEQRNWTTQGIAKFAEILRRNNDDINKLSYEIISNLVKYMDMNQGGIFIVNDDDKNHIFLEMTACYAYDRRKFIQKRIEIGEGLVGACYQEQLPIYMTEVPENYVSITSGLGEATPRCILIVPMKLNEEVFGVIELASFRKLKQYEIEFVEKVAESIAATISSVKINIRTANLLERSQQQAEEMRAQEEEMRQNMEELQATQEEMARKNAEIQSIMEGINLSLPYIEFDKDEHIININDTFTQTTGLLLNEIKGLSHRNFVSQEYINSGKYFELWSKIKMGIPVTEEFEHNIKGRKIIARETFVPVRDKDGSLIKVMMFLMDLTEQKKLEEEIKEKLNQSKEMEEEMRQNLEELQATQEEMMRKQANLDQLITAVNKSSYCVEYDMNGKILKINNVVCEKLNITEADVIGKNHKDFIDFTVESEKDYYTFWENLRKGIIQKKLTRKIAKGKAIWLSETYTPIMDKDGQYYKVINIAFDITEQKELEIEAVRKAQELMEKEKNIIALNNAIDAEYCRLEITPEGSIIFANNKALEICGLTEKELFAYKFVDLMPQDIVKTDKFEQFWRNLTSGIPQKGGHKYLINGREIWLYCTYTPVKNQENKVEKIIIVGNDISIVHKREVEAKNKIDELTNIKQKLEEEISKYKDQLTKINEQLEEKNREIEALRKQINDMSK